MKNILIFIASVILVLFASSCGLGSKEINNKSRLAYHDLGTEVIDLSSYILDEDNKGIHPEITNTRMEKLADSDVDKQNDKWVESIIIAVIILIFSTFFVFKKDNIRRFMIFCNGIFPMHKEPYEPTELRINIAYITYVILFVLSIVVIIIDVIILMS